MSLGHTDGADDLSVGSRATMKPSGRLRHSIRRAMALLLLTGAASLLWAATDAEFEAAVGVDKALAATPPTLTKDGDIEGKTFEVADAFGRSGCKAKFEFAIAKSGTYPYAVAAGRVVKAIYVKINATFDKTKCDKSCQEVKILQVLRDYTKNESGGKETLEPDNKQRRQRAGWDKAAAPSRGWRVDTGEESLEPFYGPDSVDGTAENGSTDKPAIARDVPGLYEDTTTKKGKNVTKTTKKGKDLVACAVCVDADAKVKSQIIACVNYGFYIDAGGKLAFDPKPPTTSGTAPQPVKDALDRFEKIPKNTSANIEF